MSGLSISVGGKCPNCGAFNTELWSHSSRYSWLRCNRCDQDFKVRNAVVIEPETNYTPQELEAAGQLTIPIQEKNNE